MKNLSLDILRILGKAVLSTLIIGYLIFNLIYIMNPCPIKDNNVFKTCRITIEDTSKNIFYDQGAIFFSYANWMYDAAKLDFGRRNPRKPSTEIFPDTMRHFKTSFKLIFLSVFIGLIISMITFRLSYYQNVRKYIIDPIMSISFFHLIILCIVFSNFIKYQGAQQAGMFDDLVVCFILIFSNGMLYDYLSLLRNEHDLILNKDYAVFAKHSGFQKYIFVSKEMIISFIYITVSRIPVLFASLTVLEILSKGKYWGIGYDIWFYLYQKPVFAAFFASTFVTVLFFTLLYFIAEHLKAALSPKLNRV